MIVSHVVPGQEEGNWELLRTTGGGVAARRPAEIREAVRGIFANGAARWRDMRSNLQAIALSRAPVIASHSAARAVADHSRNMDDEQLLALKKNGGVIQTVAFDSYVKIKPPDSPERAAAIAKLRLEMGLQGGPQSQADATRNEFRRRMAELDQQFPPPPMATVSDFVDHIDYLVKKIGIDHVGISSDFDGGGGVKGWNGADETFNVTLELVRRGYTEEQIGKIWSGNLLRVMDEVQKIAADIQAGRK